jgi:hypothetical protein
MTFDLRWTCDSKNLPEFKHVVAVMHRSSSWILREEEGLYRDLSSCSSGWRSNGCGRAARSGSGSDLSS